MSVLQTLGVINGEELVNDREEWRGVMVAMKGLNGLFWAMKEEW